jgi:D-glycero-D-manno-heptose 1,7-bisphosphate phosphatase
MMRNDFLQKVVFLDRDGVINVDSPDYIKNLSEFHFISDSLDALRRLNESGFTTIVITNQSAVNRGMIPKPVLHEMHDHMRHAVAKQGGRIDDIFYCPHRPDEECLCRKPKPGLIQQAQKRHRIDPSTAWMVGDSVKDIGCARNAGCGHAILVRTGNGRTSERLLLEKKIPVDHVAENLREAVDIIITQNQSG